MDGLRSLIDRLPLRAMNVVWAVHVAAVAVGAVLYEDGRLDSGIFNLDGEGPRYWVLVSTTLLLAAAAVAALARSAPATVFAGFLAFMAVDEAFEVHEHLESALSVDWPILYSPVMAAAGLAALTLLRRHGAVRWFRPALVAGGSCWAIAVVLEKLQWTDAGYSAAHYDAMMIPEELLEATGSYLFAVALALVVRSTSERWRQRRAGDAAAADAARSVVGDDPQLRSQGGDVAPELAKRR